MPIEQRQRAAVKIITARASNGPDRDDFLYNSWLIIYDRANERSHYGIRLYGFRAKPVQADSFRGIGRNVLEMDVLRNLKLK